MGLQKEVVWAGWGLAPWASPTRAGFWGGAPRGPCTTPHVPFHAGNGVAGLSWVTGRPVLQPCTSVQVVPYFPQGRALCMGQNNRSLPAEAGAPNEPEPLPVVLSRSLPCPGVNHLRPLTPTTQARLWRTSAPAWSCSGCPSVLHIRRCASLPSSPVIPEPQEPRWQWWLGYLLRLPLHLVPPCWGAAVSRGDQHPQAVVGAQTPASAHGFCPGRPGLGLEAGQLYRLWTSLALSGHSAAHCSRTAWTSGWEPCPGAGSPRWRPSSGLGAEGQGRQPPSALV